MGNKEAVIFIGPPGAGKGTQAILLEEELGFYHLETAQLIEQKFTTSKPEDSDYEEIERERILFDKGILLTPKFIARLLIEQIRKLSKENASVVFSGSPRTVFEAEHVIPVLIEEYGLENVYIIHIPVSEETSIKRNSHRRICEKSRHPIPYTIETKDLKFCPEDGSSLITRGVLDSPETIKIRLKEYKERTAPVLDLVKDKFSLKIHRVDGEKPIGDRFEEIKYIISKHDNN